VQSILDFMVAPLELLFYLVVKKVTIILSIMDIRYWTRCALSVIPL